MSKWIDFDMLMSELDLYRDNAARIVKAYKENPLKDVLIAEEKWTRLATTIYVEIATSSIT